MSESAKWRSGRAFECTVSTTTRLPGGGSAGREGKGVLAFGYDEGETAEYDRDVMVPASERAAFVVVQTKLTLGVLIDALGSPPFLHTAHKLPPSHRFRQRRDGVLARLIFVVGPLDQQPHRFALGGVDAVVLREHDALGVELGRELLLAPSSPRRTAKATPTDRDREVTDGDGLAHASTEPVQSSDGGRAMHSHGVVQSEASEAATKLHVVAVGTVRQHQAVGKAVSVGAR